MPGEGSDTRRWGVGRQASLVDRYGPWALVAGASVGLGAAFARQLAGHGFNLVLLARRDDLLRRLADDLIRSNGIEVRVVAMDLAAADVVDQVAERVDSLEIGLLVYNAALSGIGPFLSQSLESLTDQVRVNCHGPMALSHLLGGRMAERGRGGVLLMSSLSGFQGSALIANYAATKAYNLVLAEGLGHELRRVGVDVLVCCAGATRTPGYEASKPSTQPWIAPAAMDPDKVVAEALRALGRRQVLIPGRANRWMQILLSRLLPRAVAVRVMGKTMEGLYGDP